MEEYTVTIVDLRTNSRAEATIYADEAETSDDIILKINLEGKEISAAEHSYFSAFQKLRDMLLEMDHGIKCCGSRLNAVQSGMMGSSDKIYLVQLGRPALLGDIVSLYDYSDINEFPDTQEQNEFFEKWTASL